MSQLSIIRHMGLAAMCGLGAMLAGAAPTNAGDIDYRWERLATGGGSALTGLLSHPTEPSLLYARGPGGLLRWVPDAAAPAGGKWRSLLDCFPVSYPTFRGVAGCDGLALDPGDSTVLYAALRTPDKDPSIGAGDSGLWKSTARGDPGSWKLLLACEVAGGGPGSEAGEPIAVDPRNSSVVYFGTRYGGLRICINASEAAPDFSRRAAGVPAGQEPGIRGVLIDGAQSVKVGNREVSRDVYVAVWGEGLYHSRDGGQSFALLPDSPKIVLRMALLQPGMLLVSTPDGLWRRDAAATPRRTWGAPISPEGLWRRDAAAAFVDISPQPDPTSPAPTGADGNGRSFGGLAVDERHPDQVIVACAGGPGNTLWRTTNARVDKPTWTALRAAHSNVRLTSTAPGFDAKLFAFAPRAIVFPPAKTGEVWFADSRMVWRTADVWAQTTEWATQAPGLDGMASHSLLAPASGGLLAVVETMGAVRIADPARGSQMLFPHPCLRLGGKADHLVVVAKSLQVSPDGGTTWVPRLAPASNAGGTQVVLSSTNPEVAVYLTDKLLPHVTTELFASATPAWVCSSGLPEQERNKLTFAGCERTLVADPVDGNRFYLLSAGDQAQLPKVFVGTVAAGQLSWSLPTGQEFLMADLRSPPCKDWVVASLHAAPGKSGDLWLSLGRGGMWHSDDAAASFTHVPGTMGGKAFGLGKARDDRSPPTLYYVGQIRNDQYEGIWGVFRSTDNGVNWDRLSTGILAMSDSDEIEGDWRTFGRVYLQRGSSGILVGDEPDK